MNGDLFGFDTADPLDVIERPGAVAELQDAMHRWPERLREIFDVERALSMRAGMSEVDATRDAVERTFAIAHYLGSRMLYFPGAEKLRLALRDMEIHRLQGRVSVEELARRFSLTPASIYHIIRTETERTRAKLQGRLFD
ncbi:hypothetical protein C7S18_12275 [Ahniella affigens]|uniref:Mor transcription activator domain-containing protein n=1 Tax=Ahniella affigens TaxID=2021234 RepID=A0A2P1PSV6_9GAMM|nr:Mor transcription activator family protein [Ahniella affigens]AVP97928.1 hypothetical protein C7S18_12275 [Ahniella affigens]